MITPQQVQAAIARVDINHVRGTGTVVCSLILTNGYVVVGQAHCADIKDFDPVKDTEHARANAEREVLRLLAFVERGPIC